MAGFVTSCQSSAGTVVGEGQDCTSKHPLQHAVMVAIEAAAARDRRLWPSKSAVAMDMPRQPEALPVLDSSGQGNSDVSPLAGKDTMASQRAQLTPQGDSKPCVDALNHVACAYIRGDTAQQWQVALRTLLII